MENVLNVFSKYKQDSKNLCRDDFDGGPVSLDEIENGLFLGNLTAAMNMDTLKSLNINHILTMDSVPLPTYITEKSFLTTKYVHISDVPKEDILHHLDECIEFINIALNKNQKILVHCYYGVSRSSSIIIAYIMKKYNLEYNQAFEFVKSKRIYVQPNSGFVFQLKLYKRMDCKINRNYQKYKTYRLRLAADNVRKAKILPQSCMDIIKSDPGIIQENPEPIVYRCRKCRRVVANKTNILWHTNKQYELPPKTPLDNSKMTDQIVDVNQITEQIKQSSIQDISDQQIESTICKNILFLEPIAWMKDILHNTQGRLNCPKCTQKLGSFSWINGCHCPCGAEISPAFYLVPSKVELSKAVQNVQMTV